MARSQIVIMNQDKRRQNTS